MLPCGKARETTWKLKLSFLLYTKTDSPSGVISMFRGPGGGGLHQNSLEIDFIVVSDRGE